MRQEKICKNVCSFIHSHRKQQSFILCWMSSNNLKFISTEEMANKKKAQEHKILKF